jgi:glucokinase
MVGVGFDPTRITAALIDERARVLARSSSESMHRTARAAIAATAESIIAVAASSERGNNPIGTIGLSIPGVVDPLTERVTIRGLKNWTRIALRRMVEEALSDSGHDIRTTAGERRARAQLSASSHPPMTIHREISCLVAAESWVGAARGKENVVYFSIGEEVEVGVLANGRILDGAGGRSGSAGWLSLSENYKREYEIRGCLSTEASITSLTRRAIEEWSGGSVSLLGKLIKSDPTQLDAATIVRAARGRDALALRVVDETCRWIGRGVANLVSILNPDAVVIGGELGLSLKPFFDQIREEARLWTSPEIYKQCRIVGATAGEKAAILGAARLAWLKENAKNAR